MTDFAKAIEDAQKMPELPEELASQMPDLLSSGSNPGIGTRVIDDAEPSQIKGITKYEFEYNCARLMIGPIESGYSQGQAVYTDADDGDRLKEIMDMNLRAEAIVFKKETTFLKTGAVIIWIEWGTPKKPAPKKDREFLTIAELKSPELSDSDSDGSEDDL
jgi:hypothetical protein